MVSFVKHVGTILLFYTICSDLTASIYVHITVFIISKGFIYEIDKYN